MSKVTPFPLKLHGDEFDDDDDDDDDDGYDDLCFYLDPYIKKVNIRILIISPKSC